MFTGAIVAIAVTMALALIRALLGPSVYDRVLAVNMFGTKTVLLLSVVAYIAGRSDYLDLALAYALINFIGVLAVLEFFRRRVDDSSEVIAGTVGDAVASAPASAPDDAPTESGQEGTP
jgi:multicomponent Na+:H+ antiporter subunit F